MIKLAHVCIESADLEVTERFYGCLADEAVPRDKQGRFVLMVSTAALRPRNATAACGVGWLPMGPTHDTVLILRNMLPAATFKQSIQAARYDHRSTTTPNTTGPATAPKYVPVWVTPEAAAAAVGCARTIARLNRPGHPHPAPKANGVARTIGHGCSVAYAR